VFKACIIVGDMLECGVWKGLQDTANGFDTEIINKQSVNGSTRKNLTDELQGP